MLDWELVDWPKDWGTNWTFNPTMGRLRPEDEPMTVEVTVDAPEEENTEYSGVIKLCAICDPNKCCEIDVYLKTPRTRVTYTPLLLRLFERFPNAFPILRQLLGFQ